MNLTLTGWLLLVFFVSINLLLGILVVSRRPGYILNNSFLAIAIGLTLCAGSSIVSDNTANLALSKVASGIAFGTGFSTLLAGYYFSFVLLGRRLRWQVMALYSVVGVMLTILFSTPLVYDLHTQTHIRT